MSGRNQAPAAPPELTDDRTLFSGWVRGAVFWRASYACERCEYSTALGIYARRAKAPAPALDHAALCPSNALVLCLACARWIARHPGLAMDSGWRLPLAADPAGCQVVIYGRGWRYLGINAHYIVPPIEHRKAAA